jgi:hypothetical protein
MVGPDWRVLAFTVLVSIGAGVLFGLVPAFRSTHIDLSPALKGNASSLPAAITHFGGRLRIGNALVLVQVSLSTIVLIGAGLLVRTRQNLNNVNPGFDARNILTFGIDPTLQKHEDARIRDLYRDLQQRLAALPGVASVGYSTFPLLNGYLWTTDLHVEGQPEKSKADVDMLATGTDFFKTMRIPLVGGRTFTDEDFRLVHAAASAEAQQKKAPPPPGGASAQAAAGPPIPVIVNRTFVQKFSPDRNPLGKLLTRGDSSGTSGGSSVGKPIQELGDRRSRRRHQEQQPLPRGASHGVHSHDRGRGLF